VGGVCEVGFVLDGLFELGVKRASSLEIEFDGDIVGTVLTSRGRLLTRNRFDTCSIRSL
jgi:hypothetical protein